MAKFIFAGMTTYLDHLDTLRKGKRFIKQAVYEGADIVANAIRKNLEGVKCNSTAWALAAWQKQMPTYITYEQKQALLDNMGLCTMVTEKGYTYTKLGFEGYNDIYTRKFPGGQPLVLIARALESGSVAMIKQPFVRPALQACEKQAVQAMSDTIDREIEKITGG